MKLISKNPDNLEDNIKSMDRLIEKMRQRKEELERSIAWAVNFRNHIASGADLTQDILMLDDIENTRL